MDREQMKHVILNLCLNAIQAMADGGTLVLRGQRNSDGRWVLFTVEDSGPGVSSDHIHKLFDPFFSTKEGGIGLGLSIAHRIIDAHRGKIEVESLPQGGARFTVWLPVAEDHESLGGPESMSVLLR
jgi:signal transduction histidine kinase